MDIALQINEPEKVFCVPRGLRELSNDIVREVLRFQPENIYCFISDYLDTMLEVREKVRESAQVIDDIYMQGYFLNNLYKTKGICKEEVDKYATTIQANWRGYIVRKKLSEYLKKRKKLEEEKERKKSQKIGGILSSLGINVDEEGKPKPGKWVIDEDGQEFWVEDIPIDQRIKEEERAFGRFDKWEREEYEDYFEIDEVTGEILYQWPKAGQIRKVPREEIPSGVQIIQFFGMRDLQGKEQYSYLIESQHGEENHGIPVGFLIPIERSELNDAESELRFAKFEDELKRTDYTYVFREEPERTDLIKFFELLGSQTSLHKCRSESKTKTLSKETNEGNNRMFLLPRVLVRIQKEYIQENDEEVHFLNEENNWVNKDELYTLKAENLKQTAKIIKYIMQNPNITVRELMEDVINREPYKTRIVGRFLPVENFETPKNIQKIEIIPESNTGKDEMDDLNRYEYIFLPKNFKFTKTLPKGEFVLQIPIIKFQGYHTEYQGSKGLGEKNIFIMGPMLPSPDGKPFTYESMFWDDYGVQAWYQHLHNITVKGLSDQDEDFLDLNFVEEMDVKESNSVKQVHRVKSKKSKSKSSEIAFKKSSHEIEPLETLAEADKEPSSVLLETPTEEIKEPELLPLTPPIELTNVQESPVEISKVQSEQVLQEEEKLTTSETTDTERDDPTTDTELESAEEHSDQPDIEL